MVYGKLHPGWFQDNTEESLQIEEPGFKDLGHTNARPQQISYPPPLKGIPPEVYRFSSLPGSRRDFTNLGIQMLLMSPKCDPEQEYNQKMLNGWFREPWKETEWVTQVRTPAILTPRTPISPVTHKIFLPAQESDQFYEAVTLDPHMPQQLVRHMYPRLKLDEVTKSQLFMKRLTPSDVTLKYTGPVDNGGVLLSLDI